MRKAPIVRDIVLVGGGHSHALFISKWAMNNINGVRITLISPDVLTPYSGMLPGLVAGQYSFEETHIDLSKLCQKAGVRFIQDSVTGLSPAANIVKLKNYPNIEYDQISFDTGATPEISASGAKEYSIPVKPISGFYSKWQGLVNQLKALPTEQSHTISVVGNGAGGIELILAMQSFLAGNVQCQLKFQLIARGTEILSGYPARLQRKLQEQLAQRNIQFISNFAVASIATSSTTNEYLMTDKSGQNRLLSHSIFWCTGVRGATWLNDTELDLNDQGFIRVRPTLQSLKYDNVFAAGDVCHFDSLPLPKAGVYAVRMADTLLHNISEQVLHHKKPEAQLNKKKPNLTEYKPQNDFLSLLALGNNSALGCKYGVTIQGRWVWQLKDRIDRNFMAMLNDTEQLEMATQPEDLELPEELSDLLNLKDYSEIALRCGGCGAKVGVDILHRALADVEPIRRSEVIMGLDAPDDAAVIEVPNQYRLAQTIDQFKSFIDDPYLFGRIAAEHALSDMFAMFAEPVSALATVTLPFAQERITQRDLTQLMQGAVRTLNEANCQLVGGHTAEGRELSLGFNINGLIENGEHIATKQGMRTGDRLILTKPLGTGVLFAAHMRAKAQGVWIEEAITSMLQSNRQAASILRSFGISNCTDITGFGLLGHLIEMLKASNKTAQLELNNIPSLKGSLALFNQGYASSLQPQNIRLRRAIAPQSIEGKDKAILDLIFDPQTSGGLLFSAPQQDADSILAALRSKGYQASVIGSIKDNAEMDALVDLV